MRNIILDENNNLMQEIFKDEYDKTIDKSKVTIKYNNDNPNDFATYYKSLTDNEDKIVTLNYAIYELLKKIKNIGVFFVLLTLANIVASVILSLR